MEFNSFDSKFHRVASHQDKNKSWGQITLREKINVIVDRLTGLGLIAGITDGEFISSEFPSEQIRVSTDGHKVTSSLKNTQYLLELLNGPQIFSCEKDCQQI